MIPMGSLLHVNKEKTKLTVIRHNNLNIALLSCYPIFNYCVTLYYFLLL